MTKKQQLFCNLRKSLIINYLSLNLMKHYNHQFMRAMLFIAVLFTSFLGVAASAPGLLTDTNLPQIHKPKITATVGVGKYTVDISGGMGI